MELKQIQDLIKFVAKSGVEEVEMEQGDFKITIKAKSSRRDDSESAAPQHFIYPGQQMMPQMQMMPNTQAAPQQAAPQASSPAQTDAPAEAAADSNLIEIKAPMIGTFYRASGPDKDAFVKVGDVIKPGQVICIVEAMKLFNEIESEVSGKIVKVLVDDAAPVEYDQPLFLVDPS